jgi:hypothetical protein
VERWILVGEDPDAFRDEWLKPFLARYAQHRILGRILDLGGGLWAELDRSGLPREVRDDIVLRVAEYDDAKATRAFLRLICDCGLVTGNNELCLAYVMDELLAGLTQVCRQFPARLRVIKAKPSPAREVVVAAAARVASAAPAAAPAASVAATAAAPSEVWREGLTPTLKKDPQVILRLMDFVAPPMLERIGLSKQYKDEFVNFLKKPEVLSRLSKAQHVRDEIGAVLANYCREHRRVPRYDPNAFLTRTVMDNILWQVAGDLVGQEVDEQGREILKVVDTNLQSALDSQSDEPPGTTVRFTLVQLQDNPKAPYVRDRLHHWFDLIAN